MASLSLLCPTGCCHCLACPALSPCCLFKHFPFYVSSAPFLSLFSPLFPFSDHMRVFLLLWVPDDSLVAVNLCVCVCVCVPVSECLSVCGCAGLRLTCVCCSVNLCDSTDVLESLCWSSFLTASVNWLVTLCVQAAVCMCVLCFNSGGQAAANSSLEGALRGASERI